MPPGIHQYSVIVSTPQREMKFTAPTKERHDIWYNVSHYFVRRCAYLIASNRLCNTSSPGPVSRTSPG